MSADQWELYPETAVSAVTLLPFYPEQSLSSFDPVRSTDSTAPSQSQLEDLLVPSKFDHPKYTPYGAVSRISLPVINPSTQYETMGAQVLV